MADKIRKIQRKDVTDFLGQCAPSKPIIPVILDDAGLPRGERGRGYVRALFSNPEKLGKRCVVSNKCRRFLKFAGEDEELRKKVEFVNFYLADGIQNTADGKKECTIYIVPDYSFCNQMFVSLFRVLLDNVSKILAMVVSVFFGLVSGLQVVIPYLIDQFPDIMEKIEGIEFICDLIPFVLAINVPFWLVLVMCGFVIGAVRAADRACAKAVGQRGDNIVFLTSHIGWIGSFFFAIRWMDLNKFYRKGDENPKKCTSFCITDDKKSLCTRDDVRPIKIFQFGENAEDGYRFLLAVLEHYSSLEQELILKYYKDPQ